jgi:hypothetical protein
LPRPADLSPKQFRDALLDHGFAFLGRATDLFIDIRHPKRGTLKAVKAGGKILRRETFAALLAARTTAEIEKAQAIAERARIERVAGAIAPTALPPCRADLTDAAAIAQLADDFIVSATRAEGVAWGDLIRMGWNAEQLKTHADAARAVADRRQSLVLT